MSCILCACSVDASIETTYDPCSPMVIVPGADTRPTEIESIGEALQTWSEVLPLSIEIDTEGADPDALRVIFESGDPFYRAMYFDALGEILIARDKLAEDEHGPAIAHELGHAFGLYHVPKNERSSVMNVGNLEEPPNEEDAAAVRALWPACDPGN